MAISAGSAVGYLDLDIDGFLSGLKQARENAKTESDKITSTIGSAMTSIGDKMTQTGKSMSLFVTAPLVGVAAAGIKVAADFEKSMSEVQAITKATEGDFSKLEEVALDLGATTAFSAQEVAGAMTEMAKAGWDTQQVIDGMSGVLDAAAASGEGLGAAATIIADAITGFGLAASDSTKVADLLTQAANGGTIGLYDLGESFKYVAPIAQSMGFSIEDMTTAITAMSQAGIKGSQAGTSLRTTFLNLSSAAGTELGDTLKDLNVEVTNADGTFRSMDDILRDLRTAFSGMSEEQKVVYAEMIGGKEAVSGLLAVLNMSQEAYDELSSSMYNSQGVAKETATIMQDNLSSKIEQLFGALESLAIKLGEHVIPILIEFVEWLTGLVDDFTALDDEAQKNILTWAGVAAAIGPVLVILGKITSTVGKVTTTIKTLGTGAVDSVKSIVTSFTKANANVNMYARAMTNARVNMFDLKTTSSVLSKTLSAKEVLLAVVTGKMGLMTAASALAAKAQVALNAVMSANPIMLLVGGIGLLVGALAGLGALINAETAEMKAMREEVEALTEAQSEFAQSINGGAKNFNEEITSLEGKAQATKDAVAEVRQLADANDGTAESETRLIAAIERANAVNSDLALSYNDQTGAVEGLSEITNEYIDQLAELAKAEAYRERMTELAHEQIIAEEELAKARELVAEMEEQGLDTQERMTSSQMGYTQTVTENTEAYNAALATVAEYEAVLALTEQQINGYSVKVAEATVIEQQFTDAQAANVEAMTSNGVAISQLATMYSTTVPLIEEQIAQQGISLDEWASQAQANADAQAAALEGIEEKYKSYVEVTSNMFEKINTDSDLSVTDMVENLQHNQDAVLQWADNLSALEGKIDENLLQTLRDAGPESAGIVQELVNSNQTELDALSTLWGTSGTAARDALNTNMGLPPETNGGDVAIENMAGAVDENTTLNTAMTNSVASAYTAANTQVQNSNFPSIGKEMVSGVAKGVTDNAYLVNNAVRTAIRDAINAAKEEGDIHSPSKEMEEEVGKWMPAGLANGFIAAMPKAMAAVQDALDYGMHQLDFTRLQIEEMYITLTSKLTDLVLLAEEYKSLANSISSVNLGYIPTTGTTTTTAPPLDDDSQSASATRKPGYNPGYITAGQDIDLTAGETSEMIFNFYSPKAIDEVQAAKLVKKSQRDIMEGF